MADDGSVFVVGPGEDRPATPLPGGLAPAPGPPPPQKGSSFERRYKVEGEIGRGGMGIILDGRDLEIRRELAIKVMNLDAGVSSERLARFVEEARIQGQLEHPNICPVHELGTDPQGRPFFTMKKVRGRSLAEVLREARAASPGEEPPLAQLLGVFSKICDAVAFAHARGVIHRDLKPENVMIGEFGEVLVMDWGLAKVRGGASPGARTVEGLAERRVGGAMHSTDGAVIGTPFYMPPEQARGDADAADERSDVYALGGILYTILTLEPPIAGSTHREIVDKAARGEIVPPSRRSPDRGIPPDLEASAMKALSVDPAARYPNVKALQADVTAFLEGRTLAAARYTPLQIAAKWVRRNRVFAATASVSAALLAASLLYYLVHLRRAREAADRKAVEAQQARVETELRFAEALASQGEALGKAGRWAEARERYLEAAGICRRHGASEVPARLGLWEVSRILSPPLSVFSEHQDRVEFVAVSADGRRALSGGAGPSLILWDVATSRSLFEIPATSGALCAAFSPDGLQAAVGYLDGFVRIWDLSKRMAVRELWCGTGVHRIAFSGDPFRLFTWESGTWEPNVREAGTARVWDLLTGEQVYGWKYLGDACYAFSPVDPWALVRLPEGGVKLCDLETGKWLWRADDLGSAVVWGDFSRDGRRILLTQADGTLSLWDVDRREKLRAYGTGDGLYASATFSSDGRHAFLACRDGRGRLLDLEAAREVRHYPAGGAGFHACSSGREGGRPPMDAVAFSGDGRLVVAAMGDGQLAVFSALLDRDPAVSTLPSGDGLRSAEISSDGRIALVVVKPAGEAGRAELWDLATGARLDAFGMPEDPAPVREEGEEGEPLPPPDVESAALSTDGRLLLCGGSDGRLVLWDLSKGKEERRIETDGDSVGSVAFSPDGLRVAASWMGVQGVKTAVWDLGSGERREVPVCHFGELNALIFSPDCRTLLTAGGLEPLRLWDAATCKPAPFPQGPPGVLDVRFVPGPGAARILLARKESLRLWDPAAEGAKGAHAAFTLPAGHVRRACLSRDGCFALSCGLDAMKLWELSGGSPGREIRSFPLDAPVASRAEQDRTCAFSEDGRLLLQPAPSAGLSLWDFNAPERYDGMQRSVEAARAALAKDPRDAGASAAMGEWLLFRGFHDLALEWLRRARRSDERQVSPLSMARCLRAEGDLEGSEKEILEAIERKEAPEPYLRLCLRAVGGY